MDIKSFLSKHNYLIEAHLIGNTILTKTPKKVEGMIINPMIVSYDIVDNGIEVFVQDVISGTEFRHTEELPEYAKRPYIINHIIKNCLWLEYPISLVDWYNEDEETTQANFYLSIQSPEESEKEKEANLLVLATTGISRGFTGEAENKAESGGVIEGYNKIKKLFDAQVHKLNV